MTDNKTKSNSEIYLTTETGPVYSNYSLQQIIKLKNLKSASRSKHLFLPFAPSFIRNIYRMFFGTSNKIDYKLPKYSDLKRDFIRQDPWEIEYLFPIFSRSKIGILEVGRFNGGSTLVAAVANNKVPIYSIDIEPKNDDYLKTIMKKIDVGSNVNLIVGDSQKSEYPNILGFDVLFIDGDHSFDGCYADLSNWFPKLTKGGHILLHDCYFGCEVQDSVIKFIQNYNVEIIQSPYNQHEHRYNRHGSLCHLIKK